MEEETICDGIIVWYNDRKGYGFVEVTGVEASADASEPPATSTEAEDPENEISESAPPPSDKVADVAGLLAPQSEVFLHHSALDRFGLIGIFTGDKVKARVSKSQRGWVITDLISVERAQVKKLAAQAPPQPGEVRGVVKFFNSEKGYGFVDVGDVGNDVFVHLRTLRNCGIHHLIEGQQLLLQITDDGKGPQAAEVRLMPAQMLQPDIDYDS